MSWMNLLGNAAIGYGVDKLAGGKGGIGAALGGLAGGTGYGVNLQGLLGGTGQSFMQDGLAGAVDSASGLLGGKPYEAMNANGDIIQKTQGGLLGNISNFGDKYGDAIDAGVDITKAYGNYQTGRSEQKYNEAQMNYIQSLQGQQELENLYKRNARASTQSNVDTGFANSSLGSPSNYYTA